MENPVCSWRTPTYSFSLERGLVHELAARKPTILRAAHGLSLLLLLSHPQMMLSQLLTQSITVPASEGVTNHRLHAPPFLCRLRLTGVSILAAFWVNFMTVIL